MSLGKQVSILYAVTSGFLDDIPVEKVIPWEEQFHRFMESNHPDIAQRINKDLEIKPDMEESLKAAIKEFKQGSSI
jgi:F-type H+-transporting ATPase subunit alpha